MNIIKKFSLEGKVAFVTGEVGLFGRQGNKESIIELRDKLASLEDSFDILVNNAVLRPMRSYKVLPSSFD